MKLIHFALALFLFSSICFSLWNSTFTVRALDLNGKAVENADVSIVYQKMAALSEDDGLLEGLTDANGNFLAELENKVNTASQTYKAKITVSTDYWAGEARRLELNNTANNYTFIVPVTLNDIQVLVLSSKNAHVEGASVFVGGKHPIKRSTDAFGAASISMPEGVAFTGVATYNDFSKQFSSKDISESAGGKVLTVILPETPNAASSPITANGTGNFALQLLLANGSVAQNQQIRVAYAGQTYKVITDSNGIAQFALSGRGQVKAIVTQNEYDYPFAFDYTGQRSTTIALYPLLQISSFTSVPDGNDCYRVIANVSDPRTSLPLDVQMSKFVSLSNTSLPVSGEFGGIFTSRLCIRAETKVVVRATNKYEAAGAVIVLTPQNVQVGPIALPSLPSSKPAEPVAKPKPIENPENFILPAFLIGAVAIIVILLVFGRRYLTRIPRFIAEYLHKTMRDTQKKRPKIPQMPPFGGAGNAGEEGGLPPEAEPPSE
ncbi:MAG: hypothetical protein NTV88_03975 [Candidatus Micrarchaeota archaeon]|nr:hypothetical protein [Candidatus Micrarchaeota archaeon]